jgi:phospholipid/cholesterol/gamma-HCH transport system substrate-binding protein
MTESRLVKPLVWAVGIVVTAAVLYFNWPSESYRVKIVMSSAGNLAVGAPVWINGFDSGSVMGIDTKDGKAVVTAGVSPKHAPLHAGTKARIEWYAALGERILTLTPGPASNPEIPDGGMFEAESFQVEVDQVLAALDQKTRDKLDGLVRTVSATTKGKEKDVQATLNSLGPTVEATGAILEAVGRDGPAIRALVDQLQQMIEVTAKQQGDVRNTVTGLNRFSTQVATSQRQLGEVLQELPPALTETNATLRAIPPAVRPTNELLDDLRPATHRLRPISDDLLPFMKDLRPVIKDLGPSLRSARELLEYSPAFLDGTRQVFPDVTTFFKEYQPAVSFIRPYIPELTGFLQNWGKNFGAYDSQGHLWAATVGEVGPQPLNEAPVRLPPLEATGRPKPGETVGKPWTDPDMPKEDANGNPIR